MTIRLDRLLAASLAVGSRTEAAEAVKKGRVSVDGVPAKRADIKLDPAASLVTFDGVRVEYKEFRYVMIDKPAGVLTATDDPRGRDTVLGLLPERWRKLPLGPVGRLDADVTGLVILTDDGALVHRIIGPKNHSDKVYIAKTARPSTDADAAQFAAGLDLGDFTSLPASLELLPDGTSRVTLREGKFHQVKRMFEAVGNSVTALRRVELAGVKLDLSLGIGRWRELSPDEEAALKSSSYGEA